ncbi:DEAD/DEAH box helicase family protein [Lysinibacter sp. HNR]|uniref:DEAD/DEAH box helicase family protein n=1 Tax=Lysinibacter sp. HNR TaxID=3031408 RepID=UPI002435AD8C|nr:DEAD/DEAH box helicase family protein [Lysinibacter sp. HNR]WGD37403.1 DEAD/DEAH box helicase family protein [Lysinibacter sp. HNR]
MNHSPEFPLAENISLRLSHSVPELIAGAPNKLLAEVTPVTAELLRFWFEEEHCATRDINFHSGQRDAILAIIYAHEVLGTTNLHDLYIKLGLDPHNNRDATALDPLRDGHPKYAAKMATGTGKTWVLNALLVWQRLNSVAYPDDPRFSSHFLIVAPGLIVYDRLLDSFLGKHTRRGTRDFYTGDMHTHQGLFIPDNYRAELLAFVSSSVVIKEEIGITSRFGGVIALTNWHRLAGQEDPDFLDDNDEPLAAEAQTEIANTRSPKTASTPEREPDPHNIGNIDSRAAAASFIPLSPGTRRGNTLDVLDRRTRRGEAIQWLASLSNLVVFNDEAHHVHTVKSGLTEVEVEWQKSLNRLARGKGRRFVQIDFSATPYNETGGKRRDRLYFPHIVVDFSLTAAMDQGLVKALTLDRRSEIASLANDDLDYNANRDERGRVVALSEGQRVMLRAGLNKLSILEAQFALQDPTKHPKLLVIVENTEVSPLVEEFLLENGYVEDDFLRVDSGRKAQLGPAEWEPVRQKLFNSDAESRPKIIISVLMLREGFDVNNICVIVPLRSSTSGILLEQTVGRGLRLMWRNDLAVEEIKAETRKQIQLRQEPTRYFDVLFVIEHPRYTDFYTQELGRGYVGETTDAPARVTGDVHQIRLREDYAAYDFAIPFILRESEEELKTPSLSIADLTPIRYPLPQLLTQIKNTDVFVSHDLLVGTQYGGYAVSGAQMNASGYNDYLAKLTNRLCGTIDRTFTKDGFLRQTPSGQTVLQLFRPTVVSWVDHYIRKSMFGSPFDPLIDDRWRILLLDPVVDDLSRILVSALLEQLHTVPPTEPEVTHRYVSEIQTLSVRESSRVAVTKCIFPFLPISAVGGGLERFFLEWADLDVQVEALLKIHEYKHGFLRRPYLRADGMPAHYSPDFLVRTADRIYVVETKAQSSMTEENVRRKAEAARTWCEQTNRLPPHLRGNREWSYVMLAEPAVRSWASRGGLASELLQHSRLLPPPLNGDNPPLF